MISPQNLKLVILFTLFVATFLCTMLPLGLRAFIQREHNRLRKRNLKSAISLLNCFTAGVFLGTCLLDLLPEVRDAVNDMLKQYHIRSEFPLTDVLVLLGFLMLLIIEQCVTRWRAAHGHIDPCLNHQISVDSTRAAPLSRSYDSRDSINSIPSGVPGSIERTPLPAEAEANTLLEDENENDENSEPAPDPMRHSVIRPLMLLAALSLHSIFEGLAIGLQKTVDDTLQIFVALTLHKCIVAFSIGLNNVQSRFPLRIIFGLDLFFSLMSPIGIALGIGIENITKSSSIGAVTAVLQGLACGTFLYVVFMEILPHEFMARHNRPDRMLKVLCCLIGIAFVIGIIVIDPKN